jgi:hypothetical protein
MTRALVALARFFGGFFEIRAPQSMSRLVVLLCAAGALYLAHSIDALSRRPHLTEIHVEMVKAVGVVLAVLVVNGAVAILSRPRPPRTEADVPDVPDASPPPGSTQ